MWCWGWRRIGWCDFAPRPSRGCETAGIGVRGQLGCASRAKGASGEPRCKVQAGFSHGRDGRLASIIWAAWCRRPAVDGELAGCPKGKRKRRQTRVPGGVEGVEGASLIPSPDCAIMPILRQRILLDEHSSGMGRGVKTFNL